MLKGCAWGPGGGAAAAPPPPPPPPAAAYSTSGQAKSKGCTPNATTTSSIGLIGNIIKTECLHPLLHQRPRNGECKQNQVSKKEKCN
eukprot:scaffold12436_cov15-Tisochrysis_lutea.AAC.2